MYLILSQTSLPTVNKHLLVGAKVHVKKLISLFSLLPSQKKDIKNVLKRFFVEAKESKNGKLSYTNDVVLSLREMERAKLPKQQTQVHTRTSGCNFMNLNE